MPSSVLVNAVAAYLSSVSEREFDEPLRALLRARGFVDIHYVHGVSEFGRDLIAKCEGPSGTTQYAIQSKAGDMNVAAWRSVREQIEDIRTGDVSHPGFDPSLPRSAVLVLTGRLVGDARVQAHDYQRKFEDEMLFDVWDRDRLIEQLVTNPDAVFGERDDGPVLSMIGGIEEGTVTARAIETFSRKWIPTAAEPVAPADTIEASVLANRLGAHERIDLACHVILCLLRASCVSVHGEEPLSEKGAFTLDQARGLFAHYGRALLTACREEHLRPIPLVNLHREFGFFATYSVRCSKVIELLGLLGLLQAGLEDDDPGPVTDYLARFVESHPGTGHPLSDIWAVSLIPPALLLAKAHTDLVRHRLVRAAKWIADFYEGDLPGLAPSSADPPLELSYLFAVLEHIEVPRRRESYLATVTLDLASLLGMREEFNALRNEYLAVGLVPEFVHVSDTRGQYVLDGDGLQWEVNLPYADELDRESPRLAAPHLQAEPRDLYLPRVGRAWEHLALQSVLRDRHFPGTMRYLLGTTP